MVGEESQGLGEGLEEMLFAVDGDGKAEVLLPQGQLEFEFVHGPVPESDDPFDNYINRHILA